MKKLLTISTTLLCLWNAPALQAQSSGCRDLSTQIVYEIVPPRQHAYYARIVDVVVSGNRSILVSPGKGGFYGSSDSGKTWTLLTGAGWNMRWKFPNVVIAPSDPTVVYRDDYGPNRKIERSPDGGQTWTHPHISVDGQSEAEAAFSLSRDHDYGLNFQLAAVHPHDPLTIYATIMATPPSRPGGDFREHFPLKGMYVSEDGGENWHRFTDQVGIFDRYPRDVVLGISSADPNYMLGEGKRGILRSTDGGQTWFPVGQSESLNLVPLDVEDRSEGILVATKKAPLNVKQFAFDPTASWIVYMVSRKGIHRSLDGGNNWELLDLGFDRLGAVNSFAVDPLQSHKVFAGTDRGLFVSDDRGCTFRAVSSPIPDN